MCMCFTQGTFWFYHCHPRGLTLQASKVLLYACMSVIRCVDIRYVHVHRVHRIDIFWTQWNIILLGILMTVTVTECALQDGCTGPPYYVLTIEKWWHRPSIKHYPVSEQYCWAVILLSPIPILPPRPQRRDSCEVTWPLGSIRDHWAVSSWVLAATVLETTSALSPHHRHRKVHLGLAGQPGHGGHDRDSARTGQQGELLYTL